MTFRSCGINHATLREAVRYAAKHGTFKRPEHWRRIRENIFRSPIDESVNKRRMVSIDNVTRGNEMQIAQTILEQLGGNRFIAMTGAHNLVSGARALQFKLPRGARNGINLVRIELNCNDLYDMTFSKFRNLNVEEIESAYDCEASQLQWLFTTATGLDTKL